MAATISVHKQSVVQLLGGGQEKPFVIPEYQRPYAWNREQIETLFEDLWEFASTRGGSKRDGTYFLGSVVSYDNDQTQEIIDGQQRITSLYLLLRAIYTKLVAIPSKTEEAENFISKTEPLIWRVDKLKGKITDRGDILFTSRVINNEGNEILRNILKTGQADPKAKDNYSKNYIIFQELLDEHSVKDPLMVYDFVYALLYQAIMLPITADSLETALTIFQTLNDRGLPLSDADIFKAKIYNHLKDEEKDAFINAWKELDSDAASVSENIQQLFYYYMFYIRATEDDKNTTTPGARKYYSDNKFVRLLSRPDILEELKRILNIWMALYNKGDVEEEWAKDKNILQILDALSSYPNEFWKYPVIIYYLVHGSEPDFGKNYLVFLRKLYVELLTRYLEMPTVSAVKSDILKLNVEIINTAKPKFGFKPVDDAGLDARIITPNSKVVKMILKVLAYEEQDDLLPDKWEVEHILPQKWQSTYFINTDDDTIKEMIEHIGNKLPFEKKLNIVAGNGYFTKKKTEYAKSTIAITKAMAELPADEWKLDSIEDHDKAVVAKVREILKRWNDEYTAQQQQPQQAGPSAEELAMIEKFKANGWVK